MNVDLVIVGAGPAGLAAAARTAAAGLKVVVLDEGLEPGGRLLGQLHQEPDRHWWSGCDVAHRLTEDALAAGAKILGSTSAWGVFPGFQVVTTGRHVLSIRGARVLVATGATERPVPIPGWTLPGVISVGAAQTMVHVHRVRPGLRTVVVGVNPLGISIARALALAGVEVLGVVNPAPGPGNGRRAVPIENLLDLSVSARAFVPSWLLRTGGRIASRRVGARLILSLLPRSGVRVWDVPVKLRMAALELRGKTRVEEVVLAPVTPEGRVSMQGSFRVSVDSVCLSGGLTPLVELAAAASCEMVTVPEMGGYVPMHGPEGETTTPGLWVAGSVCGVEGAASAIEQGIISGLAIAREAGRLSPERATTEIAAARLRLARIRERTGVMINPRLSTGCVSLERLWQARVRKQG